VFAIAVNDLSDVAADRANADRLGHRRWSPGRARPRQLVAVAAGGAVVALVAAALAAPWCAGVVLAGLLLAAGHSLPPARFAARGVVGPLVLPAGFVAVPFLSGVAAAGGTVTPRSLVLLGGLYAGFVGRLVLKDFRDVRGDALVGKRTFLVRRGRAAACAASAVAWLAGSSALLAVDGADAPVVAAFLAPVALVLALLRSLARSRDHRTDDRLVAAVAICGRGQLLVLIAHLAAVQAGVPDARRALLLAALCVWTAGAGAADGGDRADGRPADQCAPAAGSTSSTSTPPASFGCTKLTLLPAVPFRGAS
jgi:4-hydroxybenzoate polyprenyltransferase